MARALGNAVAGRRAGAAAAAAAALISSRSSTSRSCTSRSSSSSRSSRSNRSTSRSSSSSSTTTGSSSSSRQRAAALVPSCAGAAAAAAAATCEAGRPLPPGACIGPGLQLMETDYRVCGRVLRLVAPLDVDAVLDAYLAAGLERDPYWCRAWPSAICLATQLLQRPELVAGKRVADLGAGLGIAGLAAALAGAREVVLLDREPMALACGLLSAQLSGVAGVRGLAELQQAVDAEAAAMAAAGGQQALPSMQLLQLAQLYCMQRDGAARAAEPPQPQQLSQAQQPQLPPPPQQQQQPSHVQPQQQQQQQPQQQAACVYRAQQLDWSDVSEVPERFDVVLACDVLYEAEAVDAVAAVVPRLLAPSSAACLLLADPPNRTAAHRARFVERIAAGGGGPRGLRLVLQESARQACAVEQLDPEMLGGVSGETRGVEVELLLFRGALGNDTVGIKL